MTAQPRSSGTHLRRFPRLALLPFFAVGACGPDTTDRPASIDGEAQLPQALGPGTDVGEDAFDVSGTDPKED